MWRRSIAVLALVAGLLSSSTASAQWAPNGIPVVSQTLMPGWYTLEMVPDGASGAIIFQPEYSPSAPLHLLFRKTRDGISPPGWPSMALEPTLWDAGLAADGAGGAYVARAHVSPNDDIVIHHIGSDGNFAALWPVGGRVVGTAGQLTSCRVVGDLAGGVYAVWTRLNNDLHELRALRLDPDGAASAGWPADGVLIAAETKLKLIAKLHATAEGLYVQGHHSTMQTLPQPDSAFMVRLTSDGALPEGWSPALRPIPTSKYLPAGEFAPGSHGGFYSSASDIRYRRLLHVLEDGALDPTWPDTGLAIHPDPTLWQFVFNPVADGDGGCFARFEYDSTGTQAYMATRVVHITEAGTHAPGWAPLGARLPYNDDTRIQSQGPLVADGEGGVYALWFDVSSSTNVKLNVHHIGADGLTYPGWPAAGLTIASGTGGRRNAHAVSDAHGGLIVAWEDSRNATGFDEWAVYAIGITPTGSITAGVRPEQPTALDMRAAPTPSSGPVRLTLRMPQDGRVRVEILDLTGRKVCDVFEGLLPAGEHPFDWDGRASSGTHSPPGVYLARTSALGTTHSARIVRLGAVR